MGLKLINSSVFSRYPISHSICLFIPIEASHKQKHRPKPSGWTTTHSSRFTYKSTRAVSAPRWCVPGYLFVATAPASVNICVHKSTWMSAAFSQTPARELSHQKWLPCFFTFIQVHSQRRVARFRFLYRPPLLSLLLLLLLLLLLWFYCFDFAPTKRPRPTPTPTTTTTRWPCSETTGKWRSSINSKKYSEGELVFVSTRVRLCLFLLLRKIVDACVCVLLCACLYLL